VTAESVSVPQLRPLGIGEILDVAIKIFWRHKGTLARIVLVVVAPVTVLANLIQFSALPDEDAFSADTASNADFSLAITGFLASALLGWIGTTFATAACFKAVGEAYIGEPPKWRSSLSFVARRLHSVIWLVFLTTLVTGVGLLLCIVPGIYFFVAFSVVMPVLLLEGLRGRRAMGRSRRLISGRWWAAFALLLVGYILTGIVAAVVEGAVTAVTFTDTGDDTLVAFLVTTIGAVGAAVATAPFQAAYTSVLYFDLRVRKEAFDLQLLAQQIGVEPPAGLGPAPLEEPPDSGDKPPFWPPPPGWKPTPSPEQPPE
jgi:hypothetical protein